MEESINQKLLVRRHMSTKNHIHYKVNSFKQRHFRALVLASVLAGAIGFTIFPHESAKGAVEVSDISLPKMIFVHGPFKPDNPKIMGDYPTKVDFSYVGGRSQNHGKLIGAPYGRLIGIYGSKSRPAFLPESHTVVWSDTLLDQWNQKLRRPDVSPATRKWASSIVANYKNSPRDTKSIKTYVSQVDSAARQMHNSINYGQLCSKLKVSNCTALYKTMGRIDGRSLTAFGMTELFPSDKGEFNYVMMDTILRNAGENYIQSLPSMGDNLLSTGVYQWTSYAIRRDDSGKLGGVTIIDNFAGRHLSGSVVHLKQRDNHKATFAMATYNIAMAMRGMSDTDANRLANVCSSSGLNQAIAVSHHMPAPAWEGIRKWVKSGCSKPIQSFLNPHLKIYAQKTSANYNAIIEHIEHTS